MTSKPSIVVICLGNEYRRDDGVGLYVARQIRLLKPAGVTVIDNVSDGAALIRVWSGAGDVILVDCAHSGGMPGEIFQYDALKEKIPEAAFPVYSSHTIGVADAIELAKTLGELPESLVVVGIEGVDFAEGEGLTPEVRKAANEVVRMIMLKAAGN